MTILRSIDGKYYEIEESELTGFEVDEDRLRTAMSEAGETFSERQMDDPGPVESPQVVIEIFGGSAPLMDGPPPAAGDPGVTEDGPSHAETD